MNVLLLDRCVVALRSSIRYTFRSLSASITTADWTDCWRCDSKHQSELFCPSCNAVQCTNCTATKLNYFQVLKNELSFDVNLSEMKQYYIKLQSMLHPDRFGSASDIEQEYSTTQSAFVNEAYKTLIDPLKRGLYLLELKGDALDSEIIESNDNILLNKIFVINFAVDECENKDELQEILQQVEQDIGNDINEISTFFRHDNSGGAKETLIKLRYRSNIKKKIEDKIFNMQF